MTRRLILGLGEPLRGDDGAGPAALALLARDPPPGAALAVCGGDPGAVIDALDGLDAAVIVDACLAELAPGTLLRLDLRDGPLAAGSFALSSHGMGLAETLEVARALGALPPRCVVVGVVGRGPAERGAAMSPEVAAAIPGLAALARAEALAEITRRGP